jgi:iron complex outermembrane recepter protein
MKTGKEFGFMKPALAGLLGALSMGVCAQTATIDLPKQPLSRALSMLAGEEGVNIVAPEPLVANHDAPAISGTLTIREALNRLLQGTGLQADQQDDKTYVIKARSFAAPATNKESAVLPTITVTDASAASSTGTNFVADSTTTATRTDTPISQLAQTVQVVTKDQLQSQQAQSVEEALRFAGVSIQDSGQGTPTLEIRGFAATTMSNGVGDAGAENNTSTFDGSLQLPTEALDRIEVIKGADSILSGTMAPGGAVNIVTKQPQATPVHEVTLQTGSYGDLMAGIDLGGALTADKQLTYRFVMSAERAGESYGGFEGGKSLYVAPALGWSSGDTSLVVGYQHNVRDEPPSLVTLLTANGPIPISSRELPSVGTLNQSDTLYYDFKQRFGEIFQFESKTQYEAASLKQNNIWFPFLALTPTLEFYDEEFGSLRSYGVSTDNHVQASFETGPVKQKVLAGFSYREYWDDGNEGSGLGFGPFPDPGLTAFSTTPQTYADDGKAYFDSQYLQDQITWNRLHVLASISHGEGWSQTFKSASAWSPNVGVLYQLTDSVAAYASALRSFLPQTNEFLQNGTPAPPMRGRSLEAGFKFNLIDDRLVINAAVFRNSAENETRSLPGTVFYTLVNESSRGVDLSAIGRLFTGLNVVANYTYLDELNRNSTLTGLPRHVGSVWLTYDFPGEHLHGLGAGVGVQAQTGAKTTLSDGTSARTPGQAQTDFSVYYKAKDWQLSLAVKNVFNRTLYSSETVGNEAFVLPGRLVYLTGRYKF